MKIECVKDKLKEAIDKTMRFTGKNLTLPVLSCIKLTTKDSFLEFSATNLDIGIKIEIPAKIIEQGSIAIPADIIANFLNSLGNSHSLTIETKDDNIIIKDQNGQSTIKCLPVEDFPSLPEKKDDSLKISLKTKDLYKGVKSVYYAAANSSIKPELSSVYIYNDDKNLIFATTDSFRLAEKKIKIENINENIQVLIPAKNIIEISKVLESLGNVNIFIDKNQVVFEGENIFMVSRCINGIFPDYKQIIPKEFKTEATILKNDCSGIIKTTTIFSDSFNQIKFNVSPANKKIELNTKNSQIGDTIQSIDAVLTGEDVVIGFNYKYITDCFQSIDADSVLFGFSGAGRPLVIKGVGDDSFLYLVMPMNK